MNDFYASAFDEVMHPRQCAARLAGETLGSWHLEGKLTHGEGGFGVVYRASHAVPAMGHAAVKVFAFDLSRDPELRVAFDREVQVLKALTAAEGARRIVRIYDAGLYDGRLPWLAMEFVNGVPLDKWAATERAAGRPIRPEQVIGILRDVLTGLNALRAMSHDGGESGAPRGRGQGRLPGTRKTTTIVHRDVKPANVLIERREDGSIGARLIDFGIARIIPAAAPEVSADGRPRTEVSAAIEAHTLLGTAMTAAYSSPEMRAGRPGAIDVRSDVFQVGLLGYELMTGERYWDAWPSVQGGLGRSRFPRWLKWAVRRALDWERDRRFADPDSFLRHIDGMCQPVHSPAGIAARRRLLVPITAAAIVAAYLTRSFFVERSFRDGRESAEAAAHALNGQLSAERHRAELLDRRVKELEKPPVPPTPDPDSEGDFGLLKQLYADLAQGRANTEKVAALRLQSRQFATAHPKHPYHVEIDRLAAWLEAAAKGQVRVAVVALEEKHTFGKGWWVEYTVRAASLGRNVQHQIPVTNRADVWEPDDFPWAPDVTVEVFVRSMDDGHMGADQFTLGSSRVLQPEPGRVYTVTSDDGKYMLKYQVQALGFGPLPPFPQ